MVEGQKRNCDTEEVKSDREVVRLMRCAVREANGFKVRVTIDHRVALRFLFSMVMDKLTNGVRQDSLWTTILCCLLRC